MRVGLDCDDVLLDFAYGFPREYNRRFGTHLEEGDIIPDFEQMQRVLGPEGFERTWEEMFGNEDYILGMQPVGGAVEGVGELRRMGAELYVVTSRWVTPPEMTQRSLEQHFPGAFNDLVYTVNGGKKTTKGEICQRLRIDFFVDDSPEHVLSISSKGIMALLLDHFWNRGLEDSEFVKRVLNWPGIVDYAEGL